MDRFGLWSFHPKTLSTALSLSLSLEMDPAPLLTPQQAQQQQQPAVTAIHQAIATADHTANLGDDILNQLNQQRHKIEAATDDAQTTHSTLHRANTLITKMFRRANYIKASLCAIILALLTAICVLLYVMYGPLHHEAPHPLPLPPPPPPPPPSPPPPLPPFAPHSALSHALADSVLALESSLHAPLGRQLPVLAASAAAPAAEGMGRRLQAEAPAMGAGVIVILVFGILLALICFVGRAMRPALAVPIVLVSSLIYLVILLVLLASPKEFPGDAPSAGEGIVTDNSVILRWLFSVLIILSAIAAAIGVLVLHCSAPQSAAKISSELLAKDEP